MEHVRIIEEFDKLADNYDNWYGTPLGTLCYNLEKDAILSLVDIKKEDVVLDVSCGTGNLAIEIAKRGNRVVALDNSREMLKVFQKKIEKENVSVNLKYGNSENLPFQNNNFDIVLNILNLEFTEHPELTIKECLRVLKPDGKLIIGILNKYSIWTLIRKIKSIFIDSIWRYAHFFSLREFTELITDENAKTEEIKYTIYFPPINQKYFLKPYKIFEKIGERIIRNIGAFIAVKIRK